MDYKLALELKKEGFPCDNLDVLDTWDKNIGIPFPTLSELIEACGDRFSSLNQVESADGWYAYTRPLSHIESFYGSTPEEAVARLWLALNKKS